ncbi:hypothetical protein [Streptomyces tauricus]
MLPAADPAELNPRVNLLRAEHTLPEGRWDCYLVPRDTSRRTRVRARLVEQAALLHRPPVVDSHGVSAWIPYTTAEGFLALRTWLRPAHAEITGIVAGERSVTVTATLYGTVLAAGTRATVIAVSRIDPTNDMSVPVDRLGPSGFRFTVAYEDVMARRGAEHDVWDLRLVTGPGTEGVPVGRIGGDVVDRKKVDVLPAAHIDHRERGTTRVRPFLTVTNDLALGARDIMDP